MSTDRISVRLSWGAEEVLGISKPGQFVDAATAARLEVHLQRGARTVFIHGARADLERLATNVGLLRYDGAVNAKAQKTAGIVSRRISDTISARAGE